MLHAFRPTTIREIQRALGDATEDLSIAVIVLTSDVDKDYTPAFCAGVDQTVRDLTSYQDGSEKSPRVIVRCSIVPSLFWLPFKDMIWVEDISYKPYLTHGIVFDDSSAEWRRK